jgi:H+/gluconate symporter-like permease
LLPGINGKNIKILKEANHVIGVLGVMVAIALVIFLAYKGWGIIPASLLCSVLVVVTNQGEIATALGTNYADGFKYFAGSFFLIFVLGSLFGKVMGDSGSASAFSYKLIDAFGAKRAVLVVILATAVLTYGGVNLFIVIFTVYPIALILFKAVDLPKRLIVASIALGAGTFTMTALPGSPAIQNLIPAQVLGTTPTASPVIGIVATLIIFLLGYLYIMGQAKKAQEKGEHFVAGPRDNIENLSLEDKTKLPDWKLACFPMVLVIGLIFGLKSVLDSMSVVSVALVSGILFCYAANWRRLENPMRTLNEGSVNSVVPLINTAAIVGFGFVVQNVAAFQSFVKFALGLSQTFNPLVSAAIAVNVVAGITGSASGGLTIFMKTMGAEYIAMGVNPEVLHRITAIASGGLDSLPHSGAVITLLMVMGVTHKEGYKDLGVVTLVVPIIALVVSVMLGVLL